MGAFGDHLLYLAETDVERWLKETVILHDNYVEDDGILCDVRVCTRGDVLRDAREMLYMSDENLMTQH